MLDDKWTLIKCVNDKDYDAFMKSDDIFLGDFTPSRSRYSDDAQRMYREKDGLYHLYHLHSEYTLGFRYKGVETSVPGYIFCGATVSNKEDAELWLLPGTQALSFRPGPVTDIVIE